LISGRGAQDRNETVGKHEPFFLLADYLTRNGIAVLRFDDRGVGQSEGTYDFFTTTKYDIVADVEAALKFLKTRPEIEKQEIGLIGHSEGGVIAAIVASERTDVAFVVLLASPGLNGIESLYFQVELVAKSFGVSESGIEKYQDILHHMSRILEEERDRELVTRRIIEMYKERSSGIEDDERRALRRIGYSFPEDPDDFALIIDSPGWYDFFTYAPEKVFQLVKCPVLALNGVKDLQVPPNEHLTAIEIALEEGGNSDYTILEVQDVNHMFQTAHTGSPSEYEQIEETISPKVLKEVKEWILRHSG